MTHSDTKKPRVKILPRVVQVGGYLLLISLGVCLGLYLSQTTETPVQAASTVTPECSSAGLPVLRVPVTPILDKLGIQSLLTSNRVSYAYCLSPESGQVLQVYGLPNDEAATQALKVIRQKVVGVDSTARVISGTQP